MDRSGVTVERLISAPPAAIFELLADPREHPKIDGSGAVKGPQGDDPQRLTLGARFGMRMQAGLPYSMMNTVIEFEENRRIAWQTTAPSPFGRLVGGRIWRYELVPAEGGTLVKETWDLSQDRQRPFLQLFGLPARTKANMERTLERIGTLLQTTAGKPTTGA